MGEADCPSGWIPYQPCTNPPSEKFFTTGRMLFIIGQCLWLGRWHLGQYVGRLETTDFKPAWPRLLPAHHPGHADWFVHLLMCPPWSILEPCYLFTATVTTIQSAEATVKNSLTIQGNSSIFSSVSSLFCSPLMTRHLVCLRHLGTSEVSFGQEGLLLCLGVKTERLWTLTANPLLLRRETLEHILILVLP